LGYDYVPLRARLLRIEYSGAVYHLTSKENEKIEEAVERYGLALQAGSWRKRNGC
jgi:hypothetical protein